MTDKELLDKYLSAQQKEEALEKLNNGYPIQYILGNVEFYNLNINVDERVLIPRFETEYLVEKTIKYLNILGINKPNVLEIGTGSGCISIALKKNLDCLIDAIDISKDAIDLAKDNAKLNNVLINYKVVNIENYSSKKKYNLIISNPPYVKYDEKTAKSLRYEPQNAIFAPNNGLYYYDIILNKIKNNLKDNYLIAFEIDDMQGEYISKIAKKYLGNINIKVEKDYNNLERYLFITKI